jgi:transposase-like protein
MSAIEVPEGVQAPKISPARRAQHSGDKIASILSKTGSAQSGKIPSLRGLAREVGVAQSTIRYWMNRKSKHHLDAETVAFLESPAGVRFLGHHRKVAQSYAATTSVNMSNTENYPLPQWLNDFVQVTCWCNLRNFTLVAEIGDG